MRISPVCTQHYYNSVALCKKYKSFHVHSKFRLCPKSPHCDLHLNYFTFESEAHILYRDPKLIDCYKVLGCFIDTETTKKIKARF